MILRPAPHRLGRVLAPRGPPLGRHHPVAHPLPTQRQAHRAQLVRPRAVGRTDAAGRQLRGTVARRAPAAQPRWPDVEHFDPRRDPVLPGIAQQPNVPHTQRQRPGQAQPRRGRPQLTHLDRHGRGPDVQHELAVQFVRRPQADVDLRGVQPGARGPNGVPAADVVPVQAPQVQGDARHRADRGLGAAQ